MYKDIKVRVILPLSMGRRALAPQAGERKRLPLKLPDDLALDLWAFCELHYGVPHNRIIEKAVRKFIDDELADDARARSRFDEIRGRAQTRRPMQVMSFPRDSG